jgi:hypothetical protein
MFDKFGSTEGMTLWNDAHDLVHGAATLVTAAVESFALAIEAHPRDRETYAAAYAALRDALDNVRHGDLDEAEIERQRLLAALDPSYIVRWTWRRVEAARRTDGLRNPYPPTVADSWLVAERLLDLANQPVSFAEMKKIAHDARPFGSLSGTAAATLVVEIANANLGRLAPARTKIDGKAAYLVRESDDEPDGHLSGKWSAYSLPEIDPVAS